MLQGLCYNEGMKARSAKTKKRKLHHPTEEMERAKRIHATAWWQHEMEAERRSHEPERRADYKQPYRIVCFGTIQSFIPLFRGHRRCFLPGLCGVGFLRGEVAGAFGEPVDQILGRSTSRSRSKRSGTLPSILNISSIMP